MTAALIAGQRGAQVVADGGQQRGADAVALGQLAGPLRLAPAAAGGPGRRRPGRRRRPAPGGPRRAAPGRSAPAPCGRRPARRRPRPRAAGSGAAVPPTLPAQVHGATSLSRSSSATDSMPKVSRTRSSSASRLVSPRSTLPARKDRISDSARSRAAWWVRRAARSTTEATDTATADEDHDGDDVLRVGDGQGVRRAG